VVNLIHFELKSNSDFTLVNNMDQTCQKYHTYFNCTIDEFEELTQELKQSIDDLTGESIGMRNDLGEVCPICLDIPKILDSVRLHHCPEKYLPGYGHKHCNIECRHSFCPNCLNHLMRQFENEYGDWMHDTPYPCPICRRDIGDMLDDYWSEKERLRYLNKQTRRGNHLGHYYRSVADIFHKINHQCSVFWCLRAKLPNRNECAIHYKKPQQHPGRSCGHCGKHLRETDDFMYHIKHECYIFENYNLDGFFQN